jgi:hypothetical protein
MFTVSTFTNITNTIVTAVTIMIAVYARNHATTSWFSVL